MAIYLVQHGKSLPKEADPEKGLSQEGREEVLRIAEVATRYNICPQKIIHSGKKRALQTAEILSKALNPSGGIDNIEGMAPMDDVAAFAAHLRADSDCMYVGHLPFMEKLTAKLTVGVPEYQVFAFQNGGIVCLDKKADSVHWHIKWTLMPHIG